MTYFEAFILAVVEGITEFLPISSTGHMIITSAMMGLENTSLLKIFTVNIQFGAILSVIILYWRRFFKSLNFYYKLIVAFLPAAIVGFLLGDFIDSLLENVIVVAINLLLGGVVLVYLDKWLPNKEEEIETDSKPSYSESLKIGFFQCLALFPGVSRSAATIIGGMTQGMSRLKAAEFSFFLAVPTMFAASAYKLLKNYKTIQPEDVQILLFGNAVAFVVAIIAIKFLISVLTKHGFKYFGYYRILLGTAILALYLLGYKLEII
jgi:undecaprenyl-diphosphatase